MTLRTYWWLLRRCLISTFHDGCIGAAKGAAYSALLSFYADGSVAVCVSGKSVGHVDRESLTDIWRSKALADYRRMYEGSRPMPMCFRCCGMSNVIRFDG